MSLKRKCHASLAALEVVILTTSSAANDIWKLRQNDDIPMLGLIWEQFMSIDIIVVVYPEDTVDRGAFQKHLSALKSKSF